LAVNESYIDLAAAHNVRSHGRGEVCPERIFFGQRQREGFSDTDIRTFWCKKSRFFKIYGASARTKGPIFCDFVGTSFMDDPLGS